MCRSPKGSHSDWVVLVKVENYAGGREERQSALCAGLPGKRGGGACGRPLTSLDMVITRSLGF